MGSHPVVARTLHQAVLLAIGHHFLDVAPGSDGHKRKGYTIFNLANKFDDLSL